MGFVRAICQQRRLPAFSRLCRRSREALVCFFVAYCAGLPIGSPGPAPPPPPVIPAAALEDDIPTFDETATEWSWESDDWDSQLVAFI
jgi:hypothetical protein